MPGGKQPSPKDVQMSMIMTDFVASFARDGYVKCFYFRFARDDSGKGEDLVILLGMNESNPFFRSAPSSKFVGTQWLPVTTNGTDIEYLHIKSPQDVSMKKALFPERMILLDKLLGEREATSDQRLQDEL